MIFNNFERDWEAFRELKTPLISIENLLYNKFLIICLIKSLTFFSLAIIHLQINFGSGA